jgi:hypothetical protein
MKSPTKRKKAAPLKAGLICPVDEEAPKKTQTQIKQGQREAADQKTKELLKRNPTYEQLAKALHKVLLNQETLIKRNEKLKAFEAYIALVSEFIDHPGGSLFIRSVFIKRAVHGYGEEDSIRQLILKAMNLRGSDGGRKKIKKVAERVSRGEELFKTNPKWFNSEHSNKRTAELMIQEYGEEAVGKLWKLERKISEWRNPSQKQ